ncbi:MAG: MFS transporter [Planctomycetes bacterium]|nr:MFS transporter [Planctomycetota bacterium]
MNGLREYLRNVGLLKRNVWLFLCAALVMGIGRQIFMVLRNQYLVDLGLADQQVTSVQGFNSLGGLLIALPAIVIISRFRAKAMLACICIANACGFAAQGLFGTLQVFQGAALAAGVAMSLNMALGAPFLMRNTSAQERVFGFALLSAVSWPLSGFIGSLLSGLLQQWFSLLAGDGATLLGEAVPPLLFGYRATLLVAAGFVLLALVPIALVKEGAPDGKGKSLRQILTFHDKKKLLWLGLPEIMIGFGAGLTIPFFNVYFKNEWGLTPQQIAPIFMAMFAVLVVGYLATPPLVRRFGPVKVMIVAQLLSLPFFIELALGHYLWAAVTAFIARQVLMNNSDPIYKQFAQEVADDRDRNAVAVWVHSSRHIFFTIANFVAGYLIAMDNGRFRIVIAATIVCYLAAIAVELAVLPGLNRARRYKLVLSTRSQRIG